MKRVHSAIFYYIVLTLIYAILQIALPANHATKALYHISSGEYHILIIVVVLPILAVWLAAFYGYAWLTRYAQAVSKTPEGPDFMAMARGTRWIAWGFPIPAIISLILNSIANAHPGFNDAASIINTYISLIIILVAFSLISNGSRSLAQRSNTQISIAGAKSLVVAFVSIGVLFCYLVFRHLDLRHVANTNNIYYLPTLLVALTIVIPYLYTWFIGLLAAYEIQNVARATSGVLYRRALQFMTSGLVVIIAASTLLQYIRSVLPRSGHLSIGATLLVVYIIEIITALGFLLLATGAKRLTRIEEV